MSRRTPLNDMKSKRTIPGFTQQLEYTLLKKRITLKIIAKWVLPIILILILDITQRMHILVLPLLLIPLFDLKRQFHIWYKYIKKFKWPSVSECFQMLKLDTRRGYNPLSNSNVDKARHNIFAFIFLCLGGMLLFCVFWHITGINAFLYPSTVLGVFAVKALIRRSRPPVFLFLAASSPKSSDILLEIQRAVYPFYVVACLRHYQISPWVNDILCFTSYRTSEDNW